MSRSWISSFVTCSSYAALLGLSAVSGVIAQPASPPVPQKADDTITVTGQKLEKKEAKRQSRAFIGQTTVTSFEQYAQRNRPVCPRTIGIDPSYAQIVDAKIRTIASAAKVKVDKSGCAPNLFVLFTADANGLMATLRKAKPALFQSVNIRERPALYNDPLPVRWWHSVTPVGSDGNSVGQGTVTMSNGQSTEAIISRSYSSASLINKEIVINLTGSVVVVDIDKATGYPLDSIAAYAALVSLSQVKPEKTHDSLPSILSMFAPGKSPSDAPRDLTAFDYAYVSSLYEILPNRAGDVQKSQIANKMAAKLSQ
jgi:hypothetical protein